MTILRLLVDSSTPNLEKSFPEKDSSICLDNFVFWNNGLFADHTIVPIVSAPTFPIIGQPATHVTGNKLAALPPNRLYHVCKTTIVHF
jgi:hypothetical protein